MQNNYRSKAFKSWLDKLQQESWQLELIISGFSIYGLSQAFGPLELYFNISQNESNSYLSAILMIALISCTVLLFTLLLHVILRGLWIGALGLRYVSGDIDYKKLNYRPKFDRYLRKKMGSFDKYISKLEDYCSILFAVSFLLIFYILSVFIVIGTLFAVAYLFLSNRDNQHFSLFIIGMTLSLFILIGMLLTFLDFVTQGYLKKNKWLAKIYFPFYWVFSYLTLSFLYRPLVHNFLDNRFGKRLSFTLIPIYFIIILLASYNYNRSNYFSVLDDSNSFIANANNYDENITEKGVFISDASIPSKIINNSYLPVFLEYQDAIEDIIFDYNKSLKPQHDKRGLKSDIFTSTSQMIGKKKRDSLKIDYIKTLSSIYSFKIDSLEYVNPDFIYTKHNNNQQGFETVLPLKNFTEGKHVLIINRLVKKDSVFNKKTVLTIPFWYYKN